MCYGKVREEPFENINNNFEEFNIDDISDVESIAETVIVHELLEPWQISFNDNQIKYEIGILASSDQYILDFYRDHFPNEAYAVLRKGCDYDVFSKMERLENDYGATGLTVDPDTFCHVYGLYYQDPFGLYNRRFCLACARSYISEDRRDIDPYSLHNYFDANELIFEVRSMVTHEKYWCYGCERFLFHIDYNCGYNDIDCPVCVSVIPHDPRYLTGDACDTETIGRLPNNPRTIPLVDPSWPM